jgi:hypothetical protein
MTARQPKPKLPHISTKVTATLGGHTVYGVVEYYEHHNPHQVTFPVKFGHRTRIMLASDVTPLPEDQQPGNRKPPPCTCLMPCGST